FRASGAPGADKTTENPDSDLCTLFINLSEGLQQMPVIKHNPQGVFPPYRNYSHATEIRGDARLLIISGLNGYLADGETMPESFEEQGDIIWQHLGTILRAARWTTETWFRCAPTWRS